MGPERAHAPARSRWSTVAELVRRHAFWIALVLVSAPLVIAIWTAEFLPFLDYAANLGQASEVHDALLGRVADVSFGRQPWPHFVVPLTWGALAGLVGAETAGRLIICLVLILLPASVAFYSRQIGCSRWPALAAGPLLCGPVLVVSLFNFLVSLPILFTGLALALRCRGLARLLVGAAASLLLFSTHLLGMATFLVVAPAVVLARGLGWRQLGYLVAGQLAAGLCTVVPWLSRATVAGSESHDAMYRWFAVANPPNQVSPNFLGNLIDGELLTPGHHWILVGLACVLVAGAAINPPPADSGRLPRLLPPFICLCAAIVLPAFIGTTGMVSDRMTLPFMLLCLPLLRLAPVRSWLQRTNAALFAALLLLFGGLFLWHLQRSQRRFAPLLPHLHAVPRRARLLVLPRRPGQDCLELAFHHHVGGEFRARRNVITNLEFPAISTSWLRYRPDSARLRLGEEKCNDRHRLDRDINLLEQRISRWAEYALAPYTEWPRPRGVFKPALATTSFVLFARADARPLHLPPVERYCSVDSFAGTLTARCPFRLSWSDARKSCRRWGGALAMDLASLDGDDADLRWLGLRFDPRAQRWHPAGAAVSPLPPPRFDCAVIDGDRMLGVPCDVRALPLCRRRRAEDPGPGWEPLPRGHEELLLGSRRLTFRQAQRACRWHRASLAAPSGEEDLLYLHRLAAQRDVVRGPLWVAGQRPGHDRPAVCLLADGTLDRCSALRSFTCVAAEEGH